MQVHDAEKKFNIYILNAELNLELLSILTRYLLFFKKFQF